MARARKLKTPFYRFNSSPEIIRHCQTKCTLTVKGGLHIGFEPALADAHPCFSLA